jgi:type I restriction enzyme, S subunit
VNLQMLFDNFELLAEVLNGVQKLRELILESAVQGKLVPQDPNEEPASILIDRIRVDKEKLIKGKIIRKQKDLAPISHSEILFSIPSNWIWIRLNEAGDWGAGATPDRKKHEYYEGSINWFKSGELNDSYIKDSEEKISESALKVCSLRLNQPGDVLIAMYGATIGKLAILDTEATTNQAVCACTPFKGVYNRFLFFLLRAYRQRFTNQGAGGAQPNISREKIINTVVPLPPFEEQKRIVAKVDELMKLCDELEQRQQKKREARFRLNQSALDHLLAANTPEEFNAQWQRICDNFDLHYDAPETIGKLRQSILQLAVRGKLSTHNLNDVPASVLLEKIRKKKERLVKEKKIKKADQLQTVDVNQIDYFLPNNWQWVRLEEILSFLRNGSSVPPSSSGQTRILRISALRPNIVNTQDFRFLPNTFDNYLDYKINEGDLLFTRYSGNRDFVGICGVVPSHNEPLIHPDKLIRGCLLDNSLVPDFIALAINTGASRSFINRQLKTTAGQVGISGKHLKATPIPIPPLEEQKRIVAKVDQLMKLCDELEAKLMQSQSLSDSLMASIVNHLSTAQESETARAALST